MINTLGNQRMHNQAIMNNQKNKNKNLSILNQIRRKEKNIFIKYRDPKAH